MILTESFPWTEQEHMEHIDQYMAHSLLDASSFNVTEADLFDNFDINNDFLYEKPDLQNDVQTKDEDAIFRSFCESWKSSDTSNLKKRTSQQDANFNSAKVRKTKASQLLSFQGQGIVVEKSSTPKIKSAKIITGKKVSTSRKGSKIGFKSQAGSKKSLSKPKGILMKKDTEVIDAELGTETDKEHAKQTRIKWSKEEIAILWKMIAVHGNEWREVQKPLKGRTYHQVKDKGRRLLQQQLWKTGRTKTVADGAHRNAKSIAIQFLKT